MAQINAPSGRVKIITLSAPSLNVKHSCFTLSEESLTQQ